MADGRAGAANGAEKLVLSDGEVGTNTGQIRHSREGSKGAALLDALLCPPPRAFPSIAKVLSEW